MISLIPNETCFVMKIVHIREWIARNMIILSMIETTSRGSFNHIRPNTFKMAHGCGEEASAPKEPNFWLF